MRDMPFLHLPAVPGAGGRKDSVPVAAQEAGGGQGAAGEGSAGAALGCLSAGYPACCF